jgi:hypothetical protein
VKTLAVILLLTTNVIGQEGFNSPRSKGLLLEGLANATDIKKVQLLRVEALKYCMQALTDQTMSGTPSLAHLADVLYERQVELTLAQLDTTDVKQERLDYG